MLCQMRCILSRALQCGVEWLRVLDFAHVLSSRLVICRVGFDGWPPRASRVVRCSSQSAVGWSMRLVVGPGKMSAIKRQ